jgi:hypothetical protein
MLIDDLKQIAKKILVKDGNHQPLFMLCSDEHIIGQPLPTAMFHKLYGNLNAEEFKTQAVFCMGVLAKKLGANRLIMVWDAAMRTCAPDAKREDIDVTEMPLQFPKSMRTECLIFNDISFMTGKDVTSFIPYKGGEGKPVEFVKSNVPEGGLIDSRFTEIALEGYNKIS